mgnify:CR=1 FL=1
MNKVILIGNLTKDPEMRQTTNGTNVCTLSLAVNRRFKDKTTGETVADFFNVIVWRYAAGILPRAARSAWWASFRIAPTMLRTVPSVM